MNEAWSDAMKTIALATSSERPRRCIGTVVTKAALFSAVRVNRVNMPVSIGPGATLFTRMPDLTVSSATYPQIEVSRVCDLNCRLTESNQF